MAVRTGGPMHGNGRSREDGEGLARQLERTVNELTRGRIRDFRVELAGERVIVHGRADSYHVKQLALQAIGEVGGPAAVERDIRVGESRTGAEGAYATRPDEGEPTGARPSGGGRDRCGPDRRPSAPGAEGRVASS